MNAVEFEICEDAFYEGGECECAFFRAIGVYAEELVDVVVSAE